MADGPGLNVPFDPNGLEILGQMNTAAKAVDRQLAKLDSEMKKLAKDGKNLDDAQVARYVKLETQRENIKAAMRQQNTLREQTTDFTRHNKHELGALRDLAEGRVSAHSAKVLAEMFSETSIGKAFKFDKLAESIAGAAPLAMVAEQMLNVYMEDYTKDTTHIERTAKGQLRSFETASKLGISGVVRKSVESEITKSILSTHKKDTEGEEFEGHTAEDDAKINEEQERRLTQIGEARHMLDAFHIDAQFIEQRTKSRLKTSKPTTEDLNETLDMVLNSALSSKVGQRIFADLSAEKHRAELQGLQQKMRMAWDPSFRHQQEEISAMQKAQYNIHRRRVSSSPED